MDWAEFTRAAPELAELGRERLLRHDLCMLGTRRRNGWPRISPCEVDFVDDELLLGMMWRSPKAVDLLADDRCVVHSCVSDRAGTEGDFKLYGHGRSIEDPAIERAYRAALRARIDWEPPGPFHLFAIDIASAGFLVFGEGAFGMAWDLERGPRRWTQRLE